MSLGKQFPVFRKDRCAFVFRVKQYNSFLRLLDPEYETASIIRTRSGKAMYFKPHVIYVEWFCFEVKWSGVTVKFLGDTSTMYITGGPFTEGTWLYCDYFIWCVSCTVVVLTCFVMCGRVYVGVFWQMCGCFRNMCTCIYCVLYCLYCVFVLFRLCIFILICFICTSVRTTATEWQLNCSW